MGLRVLLVDCDPQASLSQGLLGPEFVESLEPGETLAALFDDGVQWLQPMPTAIDGLFLVPANLHLAQFNAPQPASSGFMQQALRSFVDACPGFDIVLFDCPPNLYQCSWNALLAADHVVIPVPPEDFGTQGLGAVHHAISNARALNPSLELLGHVVSRQDRRLLVHKAYEQRLRQLYGDSVLDTVVPEASAFKVALASRSPVSHFCPRSKAAQATARLASELLERSAIANQQHRTVA